MQPYDNQNYQEDKGLFTFYREQAEFDSQKKLQSKAEGLNKILNKAIKNSKIQKDRQLLELNGKLSPRLQRNSSKLQQIVEQKKARQIKRQQIKVKKSIFDGQQGIKPQESIKSKINTFQSVNINKKSLNNILNKSLEVESSFSKYHSQLDTIKRRKHKIYISQPPILSERLTVPLSKISSQITSRAKSNRNLQQRIQSKLSIHFKKLALQPKQFEGPQQSSPFIPISIQKRQKSALKSYRRQKQRKLAEKKQLQKNQQIIKKEKFGVQNSNEKQNERNDKDKNKLIRILKFQNRSQEIDNNLQNLDKIKVRLPEIFRSKQNKESFMDIELLKNYELKKKYKIKGLQKHSESLANVKQRIRNQLKSIKNSPKRLNHYISLRYNQEQLMSENNISVNQNQLRPQNDSLNSMQVLHFNDFKSKKQREIFCKKEQYLKKYNRMLKGHMFGIQKQEQARIKSAMEQKKQELIQNLLTNLNLK